MLPKSTTIQDDFAYESMEMTKSNINPNVTDQKATNAVNEEYLERKFIWMKYLIFYMPMWIPTINKIKRNKYLSIITISLISIVTIYHTIIICWLILDAVLSDNETQNWQIVYIIFEILVATTRFTSTLYFYKHFNQPLKSYITGFGDILYNQYSNETRKWNLFILIMVSIVGLTDTAQVFNYTEVNLGVPDQTLSITSIVALILGRIFIYWPLNICIGYSCCIFVKYYLYLLKLTDIMKKQHKNGNLEFDVILEKYKAMTESFKIDYHLYLKVTVELYLLELMMGLWIAISWDGWIMVISITMSSCNILLYPIVASLITNTFERFDALLWKYSMENTAEESHYKQLLLKYTVKYPFVIKVGSLRLSRKNVVKFVIVFAATKTIAYLLRVVVGY